MPYIIAATDFSAVADNAVNYACDLAKAENTSLVIIHSFDMPVMFSDIPMPASLITDAEGDAEERMNNLVRAIASSHPGLAVDGKVIYGSTIDALDDIAEDKGAPWIIVVGNSNQEGSSTWPDSVLIDSFKKLAFPVLAVPPAVAYKPIANLCFAFDNKHTGNDAALAQIVQLSGQLRAALHVLNIQPDAANKQEIDANAKAKLAGLSPEYHIAFASDHIESAINEFTSANNVDWLVMIPRKHSFFEGLFHKSHTRSLTHNSAIPILALHEG